MEDWQLMEQRHVAYSELNGPLYWDELELDILATLPRRHHGLYQWDGSASMAGDIDAQLDRCFKP